LEEVKRCPYCGEEILIAAKKCKHCGEWLNDNVPAARIAVARKSVAENNNGQSQTVIVNKIERRSNGIGTAGFVLALIAFILCWVPVVDWILWVLGFVFSFVGIFRRPRGLAIAGFVISLIGLIVLIVVIGAIAAVLGGAL
jgi:hypothetical protein